MWTTEFEKWLEPIEKVWGCPTFAHERERGWLYCHEAHRSEASLAIAAFESHRETLGWTMTQQGTVILGIYKLGQEATAILEVIRSYMVDHTPQNRHGRALSRHAAFEILAANQLSDELTLVTQRFYTDSGLKVWVLLESDQALAKQVEALIQNLGHEDVAAVSQNRVALLIHLKKDEAVLELIEGLYSLIEEELYVTVRIGVSEPFAHYDRLGELMISAQSALNACRLTIDKKAWCFSDRDLLPILLANPDRRSQVIGAIDKRGLRTLMEDGELINTLECFLKANLNTSEAAAKLFIHRNTLLYRLSKIEKLTGLDPRRFSDAMDLFTMVSIEKVTSGV